MHMRSLSVLLGAAAVIACADTEPEPADDPALIDRPATTAAAAPTVFVEAGAASDRQLVFVGADSTIMPADRADGVFVPFSTFSVERDGIPNEFPAPDSMAAMLAAAGVGDGDVLIIGDPIPAARAWAAFDFLGRADRAALLDGGLAAVASMPAPSTAADGTDGAATDPSAQGTTPVAPVATGAEPLDTDVRADMIVDAAWVRERLEDPTVAILDARPPAEFTGETPGDGIDRPGHIPGATNVFWQTLIRSGDDHRLRDEAELRRIFEAAGVAPDDTVVAYCRTGGQASFLYAVARHLGYDVRLYDGSYVDWSRTDYDVER